MWIQFFVQDYIHEYSDQNGYDLYQKLINKERTNTDVGKIWQWCLWCSINYTNTLCHASQHQTQTEKLSTLHQVIWRMTFLSFQSNRFNYIKKCIHSKTHNAGKLISSPAINHLECALTKCVLKYVWLHFLIPAFEARHVFWLPWYMPGLQILNISTVDMMPSYYGHKTGWTSQVIVSNSTMEICSRLKYTVPKGIDRERGREKERERLRTMNVCLFVAHIWNGVKPVHI